MEQNQRRAPPLLHACRVVALAAAKFLGSKGKGAMEFVKDFT